MVDDSAFGLARTRPHAARAEGSSAAFEHYRNDTATDATHHFDGATWEQLAVHDVGPGTSTLWMLRYRRR